MDKFYYKLIIWAVVIGGLFAYLWWKGHLVNLASYLKETREELKKCTWPTWDELRGSTVVVMVAIVLLGAFTVGADFVLMLVVQTLTR
jgi:preprotein translocase subunit SecE